MPHWSTIEPIGAVALFISAIIVSYVTRGVPKERIKGLEGSVKTLQDNNSALHEQITLQQENHEAARQQDKADCDRRIDDLGKQIAHALSEASAARSEVVKSVSEAATAAMVAANQEAMATASKALAMGQGVIIDHLEAIKATIGGNR